MNAKDKWVKTVTLTLLASSVIASFNVLAFPNYNVQQSYQKGEKVTLGGEDYEAKWWASAGDRPDKTVVQPWDTPWEKLTNNNNHDDSHQKKDPIDQENKKNEPVEDKTGHNTGHFPAWKAGSTYKGGQTVSHLGKNYTCLSDIVSPWCSSAHSAYEPGTGFGWKAAWRVSDTSNDHGNNHKDKENVIENNKPDDKQKDNNTKPDDDHHKDDNQPIINSDYTMTQAQLRLREAQLTSSPLLKHAIASIDTRDNKTVEAIAPGASSNPENVKRVESIISADKWDYIFDGRVRNAAYTYTNFLKAVGKFPRMCGNLTDEARSESVCRKTLATMFAHFTQETGAHAPGFNGVADEWRQGLHYVREVGWDESQPNGYGECSKTTWQGVAFPCAKDKNGQFKSYFGRGAKQLSYNYNYGAFSKVIYGDVNELLQHPDRVADTWLNLASAVFFYLYPQSPKPSMQDVIDGTWQPNQHDRTSGLEHGFGVTTNVINGGVECGGSVEIAQSLNRIKYYKEFARELDVPISNNEVLGCAGMKQFDTAGAGAVNTYWEQDYSYQADNPEGKSYSCKLVNYQTPHSAFHKGDYEKCVKHYFPEVKITP